MEKDGLTDAVAREVTPHVRRVGDPPPDSWTVLAPPLKHTVS